MIRIIINPFPFFFRLQASSRSSLASSASVLRISRSTLFFPLVLSRVRLPLYLSLRLSDAPRSRDPFGSTAWIFRSGENRSRSALRQLYIATTSVRAPPCSDKREKIGGPAFPIATTDSRTIVLEPVSPVHRIHDRQAENYCGISQSIDTFFVK